VFWLTWLGVMTAFMLCVIVGGVLTRAALGFELARLRKAMARKAQ
jgi:Flp pilus assembly protein protease CpaA